MAEIQNMCKAGVIHQMAHVGDTISDGTYTYTIIGINQDKPSDESGNLLPENSYGDVLTVMSLGAPKRVTNGQPVTANMNATPWGISCAQIEHGGITNVKWESCLMRSSTIPQYIARLPQETQKVIGYVQKVTGTYNGNTSGGKVSATGDKCFLLSEKEVFGTGKFCTENEAKVTFQYQYFQSIATSTESLNLENSWWLRSPSQNYGFVFGMVDKGKCNYNSVSMRNCVFPAFCIY